MGEFAQSGLTAKTAAFDRGQRVVGDGVQAFVWGGDQFGGRGDELAADGVVGGLDQGLDGGGDGDGVAGFDRGDGVLVGGVDQAGIGQRRGVAQRGVGEGVH